MKRPACPCGAEASHLLDGAATGSGGCPPTRYACNTGLCLLVQIKMLFDEGCPAIRVLTFVDGHGSQERILEPKPRLRPEELAIVKRALHQFAASEAATYSESAGHAPYAAWWKTKQDEAKRIGKLAVEVEMGLKL
jgi:hypothetical protein